MEIWMVIRVYVLLALVGMVVMDMVVGMIVVDGDLWRGTTGEVAISNNATTEANGLGIVCPSWLRKDIDF